MSKRKNIPIAFFNGKKVLDKNGRTLLELKDKGKLIIFRYVDSSDELKHTIADLYNQLTGKDKNEIMSFLDFDDDMFCS